MINSYYGNKTILITGATSGIGRELALRLSGNNCTLLLLGRREERLNELSKALAARNCRVFTYKCDVSVKREVEEVYAQMKKDAGFIDIAILNAGVSFRMLSSGDNVTMGEQTFGINFFGAVYFITELLKDYVPAKKGMIAGVSSLAETRGFPGSGYYCASKAAFSIYLESLRVEHKKHGIKVLTIKPGFVVSEMTDKNEFTMPFLMKTGKAVDIIYRGIAKEKNIIQFPLRLVALIKILKFIPPFLFDILGNIKEFEKQKNMRGAE